MIYPEYKLSDPIVESSIVPNPVSNAIKVEWMADREEKLAIALKNLQVITVLKEQFPGKAGKNIIPISINHLP